MLQFRYTIQSFINILNRGLRFKDAFSTRKSSDKISVYGFIMLFVSRAMMEIETIVDDLRIRNDDATRGKNSMRNVKDTVPTYVLQFILYYRVCTL